MATAWEYFVDFAVGWTIFQIVIWLILIILYFVAASFIDSLLGTATATASTAQSNLRSRQSRLYNPYQQQVLGRGFIPFSNQLPTRNQYNVGQRFN
jgi:hypothetical protein